MYFCILSSLSRGIQVRTTVILFPTVIFWMFCFAFWPDPFSLPLPRLPSRRSGAMCAVASCVWPRWAGALRIGYVASIATKLSDTFASEIGKVGNQQHQ